MSALFNLKVGNVEAEDIICNGQAVEEVWLDGVQVYDAYDPAAVPNGENRNYSANVSGTYDNWSTWYTLPISVKATGSMSFKINSVSTPDIAHPESGYISSVQLEMTHPKYGRIAAVLIDTITSNENQFRKRAAYADGVGTVIIQSGGGEIGNWATLEWNFHNRTVKINGSMYTWPPKWREGIVMKYNIRPTTYEKTDGNYVSSTLNCTYSITA